MIKIVKRFDMVFVALWGAVLFLPFLGSVHLFDWDEVNFAESAREMIVTGNYQKVQINYQPFMEKPPLFFWIQAMSMQIFGIGEFAARLPNALIGIITLVFIFQTGKKLYGQRMALLWVLMVTGSLTPHLYFKSGIIDPLYNLFIFSAVVQLYRYFINKKSIHAVFLGVFLGLAVITKGPVAVIILLLCFLVFWAFQNFGKFFKYSDLLIATFTVIMVSSIWFGLETINRGPVFLMEFIKYQADLFLNPVAGHGQPFWYHPLVLLLGCFPASVFGLLYLFKRKVSETHEQATFFQMMQILFWVVLILFSIVETKIVHYSSLCYLPLTFIAAYYVNHILENKLKLNKIQIILIATVGIIVAGLLTAIPLIDYYKSQLIPYIKDEFAVACLGITGDWNGFEWIPGLLLFLVVFISCYYLLKKQIEKAVYTLISFISVFLPVEMRLIAPGIERYSQGPAIDFFKARQGEECYLETLGYKSYAQYFYGNVMPPVNPKSSEVNWLKTDSIDRDAYFVLHVNNIRDHININMKETGRKGGFVFFERKKSVKKYN
ncbi:MAG: glycosyltransferase family 39 protein [Bacteroidota bacterium]|nr:glycosyltransferase family 39 protein [Bacteroidota bacterium]